MLALNSMNLGSVTVALMSSRAGSALAVSQTLAELLEANQGYLNWLDSIGAEDAKRDFIASLERVATPAFEAYYYVPTATLCWFKSGESTFLHIPIDRPT